MGHVLKAPSYSPIPSLFSMIVGHFWSCAHPTRHPPQQKNKTTTTEARRCCDSCFAGASLVSCPGLFACFSCRRRVNLKKLLRKARHRWSGSKTFYRRGEGRSRRGSYTLSSLHKHCFLYQPQDVGTRKL